jgi:hypothetical protein
MDIAVFRVFGHLLRALGGLALLGMLVGASPQSAHAAAKPKPLIVFMTDFGTLDDAVAICKGVMKGIAPEAEIIDLTHEVTPFSISEGARLLARPAQYYPVGTIFLTVIDPGVGTSRKSIVVKTKRGQYFVLPDNGLVTQVVDRDGLAGIREITNPNWLLAGSSSSTFHGRDVYSPVAAHLAHGENWTQVGPARAEFTRLDVARALVDAAGIKGLVGRSATSSPISMVRTSASLGTVLAIPCTSRSAARSSACRSAPPSAPSPPASHCCSSTRGGWSVSPSIRGTSPSKTALRRLFP